LDKKRHVPSYCTTRRRLSIGATLFIGTAGSQETKSLHVSN